jgi:5'-nucleotidase
MRPLILITNDDGVRSPGLHALAECVLDFADVVIAAPFDQQTSMSRAKRRPAGGGVIHTFAFDIGGRSVAAHGVVGTPSLSVLHGILEIAPRRPDLCLSGINYGENIGYALSTGGTVGAAMEAGAFGVPAIAASLETPMSLNHSDEYPPLNWGPTQRVVRTLARDVLERGMPADVGVYNVNVPSDADESTPIRWTRQSARNYYQWSSAGPRDWTQPHGLRVVKTTDGCEPDSDVRALAVDRVISVTPLVRELTALGSWSSRAVGR